MSSTAGRMCDLGRPHQRRFERLCQGWRMPAPFEAISIGLSIGFSQFEANSDGFLEVHCILPVWGSPGKLACCPVPHPSQTQHGHYDETGRNRSGKRKMLSIKMK